MWEKLEMFTPFLLFMIACVGAFLWNRKRGEDTEMTLNQKLLRATTKKVEKYLQKHPLHHGRGNGKGDSLRAGA